MRLKQYFRQNHTPKLASEIRSQSTLYHALQQLGSVTTVRKVLAHSLLCPSTNDLCCHFFVLQVDKYIDLVQPGGTYIISKAGLVPKRPVGGVARL